jgi:dienelactone hydrolase
MIKFPTSVNMFLGRIRYRLVKARKRILEVCVLSPGHWKWAAYTILMIMGLFMAGMAIDFVGELHIGIFLVALLFFPGLALLAGVGVRLGIKLVNYLPQKQSWIYFGAIFFVLFFFGFPDKAMVVLVLLFILMGFFLGAGIYNLSGDRWTALTRVRRVLTLVFTISGAGLFIFGAIYLLYPGKASEEVKAWSMEATELPAQMEINNPALPGPYKIDSLSYGWGKDKPRKEFGSRVKLKTRAVDGSNFLDGWEKLSGKMRSLYWKMGPDSLALNGRVWFPEGDGPFPLVLMVHGNPLDRDFSDPGYGYLGRHFASHGMIAVSVDENFLNGAWSDFGSGLETENDCRGWLLLKHLEQWREWNRCDTLRFYKKVDMDRVVLIGHSRGGEAVSVASCFNGLPFYPDNAKEVFDFNFGIRGIAAIAPVDGQYSPAGIPTPMADINYFTIHGSMDGDMRSYDGLRQMRRVQFNDSAYHFASGLYLHGANHGQFNRSWGIFDNGYPNSLLLNRKAIITVEQQEKVALVYLTAFVLESCNPGSGYLPLFKDYRSGRHWLPDLVHLNQFHESTAYIVCEYEEDLNLGTGTCGVDSIVASGLALWKEGRIPKKWGDYRNNGVFLGWNNEKDSIPGDYVIFLDSSFSAQIEWARALTFLAADAQIDPGQRLDDEESEDADNEAENSEKDSKKSRKDAENAEKDSDATKKEAKEEDHEDPVPVDFSIVLTDTSGLEYRVRLGDFQNLQPAIKPEVYKSRLFWEDAESEVILQYVSLPLGKIKSSSGKPVSAGAIRSVGFIFDAEKKGTVLLDQLGFSR